jgi:hypothetical protein
MPSSKVQTSRKRVDVSSLGQNVVTVVGVRIRRGGDAAAAAAATAPAPVPKAAPQRRAWRTIT